MGDEWFSAPPAVPLTGDERFTGCEASVSDFWRFAMSDLRMNNVRGYLAEFLVARAVGTALPRTEWDAFDVLTPDGVKVEVKSSAYLQVWDQHRLSRIVFTGLRGRTWTPRSGEATDATFNADVYVFCLQTATSHEQYDPLDVAQWEFHVLPKTVLEQLNLQSIALSTLRSYSGGSTAYQELEAAIARAAQARGSASAKDPKD
ncbi:hypothetical protein [Terrabacter sp. 2RAF25]|uniref:hypothetical protein n=1 Tax=Terrabacter sp. 2RAF25 TaxID=3232998 RepID=UPI003F96AC94